MNKTVNVLRNALLGLGLVFGLAFGAAAQGVVDEIDGWAWLESARPEKLAFIYGASSVVAIEKEVSVQANKQASAFVQGWMRAFGDLTPEQVCGLLDDWYAKHPQDVKRNVYDVLWYEYIAPRKAK